MSADVAFPVNYAIDQNGTCVLKLIDKIKNHIESNNKFFSLEFFPPRTPSGLCNLFEKCDRFSQGQPLFCDVSCNLTKRENPEQENHTFLEIASATQEITQCDTILQLNSSILNEDEVVDILNTAKRNGLTTVMVLTDAVENVNEDFESSVDLITFIKDVYQDYFTICVAGYPQEIGKTSSEIPRHQSMEHLLEELQAGADFVITQMVFQACDFLNFVKKCRCIGINIPIIPGILPIQNYRSILDLNHQSKVKVPTKIMNILKPIKDNDEAVLKYGTFLTVELCKVLLQNILCCGLHFFTLNQEKATTQVLKEIGLWNEVPRRALPWLNDGRVREGEEIRPIFWACRPNSYCHRTSDWEEFPNGRWGDSSSSGFGRFRDYHLFYVKHEPFRQELKKMWLEEITCLEDIFAVFVSFLSGEKNRQGYKVTNIPWSEEVIAPETKYISESLIEINKQGILTINSQPNVNCVASTHKIFGWGSPGGYVFQKAYLEFFCCAEDKENLLSVLIDYPHVNYHVINSNGNENHTNTDSQSSNAVTWGVFTGKMILQPTVVDPVAFRYWKDEAFELWTEQWGRLYQRTSESRKWIEHCHDTFYLANLVDNDYVTGNCLFDIVHKVIQMRTNKKAVQ